MGTLTEGSAGGGLQVPLTREFLTASENAGFWNLPTLLPETKDTVQTDDAQWIFEGLRNGQYHVIDRWSPTAGDPVRAIGITALKLARFEIRPAEIY